MSCVRLASGSGGNWGLALLKPNLLEEYLAMLSIGEHFFSYRYIVRKQLRHQLELLKQAKSEELSRHVEDDNDSVAAQLEQQSEMALK